LNDTSSEAEGNVANRSGVTANVLYLAVATGIVGVSRFLTNWLIASVYGPQEHGRFAVVFQFISMVLVAAELGMVMTYGVRQIALTAVRDRSGLPGVVNELSGVLLAVHLLMAAALFVVAAPLGQWLGADGTLLRLAAVWLIGFGIYRLTIMVANGLEAMAYSTATTLLFYAVWMAWMTVSLRRQLPMDRLFAGWAVTLPVAAAACWLLLRPLLRRHGLRWRPRLTNPRRAMMMIAASLPFSLPLTGTLILPGVVCVLLVRLNGSLEQVSYFQICFSLGILANLFAVPIAGAILPAVTRMIARDAESNGPGGDGFDRARRLVRRGVTVICVVVTLPLAVYFWAGTWILSHVGNEYGSNATVLLIIATAVVFDAFRMIVDQLLMTTGHVRAVAWAEVGRFAVLIAAAWSVVPASGARGVSMALLLSTLVNFVIKLIMAQRFMRLHLWIEALALVVGILVAGAAMRFGGATWAAPMIWGLGVAYLAVTRRHGGASSAG